MCPRIDRFLKRTAAEASSDVGAGRLAEVDDRGVRHSCLYGCRGGLAPQRVEDVARALAAERVLEGGDEVVDLVQAERRVGAVLRRSLEACSAATGRNDASRTEQLRRLHGDEADGSRGSEDEHVLAAFERRSPGERQPTGHARDPQAGGERGIGAVRHVDHV